MKPICEAIARLIDRIDGGDIAGIIAITLIGLSILTVCFTGCSMEFK